MLAKDKTYKEALASINRIRVLLGGKRIRYIRPGTHSTFSCPVTNSLRDVGCTSSYDVMFFNARAKVEKLVMTGYKRPKDDRYLDKSIMAPKPIRDFVEKFDNHEDYPELDLEE